MNATTAATIEDRVLEMFFHRRDVFVTQYYNEHSKMGGYLKVCAEHPTWKQGRCPHKTPTTKCGTCSKFKPEGISAKIVRGHLDGAITLGAYQLGNDGHTVRWGCLDFDDNGLCSENELQDAALTAQMILESKSYGMPSYLEASGGNGWRAHLWTFFAAPLPAIKLRAIYQAALCEVGLEKKPYIERFPKQSRALNGYGNLVKVPLGIHRKTKRRSQFLDSNLDTLPIEKALDEITMIDPAAVEFIIDMKKLTLDDTPFAKAMPARNFDHPSDAMEKILTRCWYFREVERRHFAGQGETVGYHDWWNYVAMLCRFGDAGINRILEVSKLDERFEFEATINLINYLRQNGYHAPSCKRLREGPGDIHCPLEPLECGAA